MSGSANASSESLLQFCGKLDWRGVEEGCRSDGNRVGSDLDGVDGVLSVKDEVQSCLPPMGLVFDGIVCGCLVCKLSSRLRDSNGELVVRGVLSCGDGMDVHADANDLFHNALGKTKEGGCLSLHKAVKLLMAG